MTIKTPAGVAMNLYTSGKFYSPIVADGDLMRDVMIAAIEADRAQRDIYELIAEALDERAHIWDEEMPKDAAEQVRSGDQDDIWACYIGPMLDQMTEELGV